MQDLNNSYLQRVALDWPQANQCPELGDIIAATITETGSQVNLLSKIEILCLTLVVRIIIDVISFTIREIL